MYILLIIIIAYSLDFVLVATLSTFNHDLHSAATTTAKTQITLPQTTLQTFKVKKSTISNALNKTKT